MNAPHKPEHQDLPNLSERPSFFGTGVIYPPLAPTEEEQKAALERLFELGRMGFMSDGTKMSRDEMHER